MAESRSKKTKKSSKGSSSKGKKTTNVLPKPKLIHASSLPKQTNVMHVEVNTNRPPRYWSRPRYPQQQFPQIMPYMFQHQAVRDLANDSVVGHLKDISNAMAKHQLALDTMRANAGSQQSIPAEEVRATPQYAATPSSAAPSPLTAPLPIKMKVAPLPTVGASWTNKWGPYLKQEQSERAKEIAFDRRSSYENTLYDSGGYRSSPEAEPAGQAARTRYDAEQIAVNQEQGRVLPEGIRTRSQAAVTAQEEITPAE
jgi:hypothetical protein